MAFSPSTLNNAGGLARPIGGLVSRRLFRCIALACLLAPALAVSQPAGQSVIASFNASFSVSARAFFVWE